MLIGYLYFFCELFFHIVCPLFCGIVSLSYAFVVYVSCIMCVQAFSYMFLSIECLCLAFFMMTFVL